MAEDADLSDWTKTKRQHMVLTGAGAEAFLKALAEPPEPNARFVEAVRRYRSIAGTQSDIT